MAASAPAQSDSNDPGVERMLKWLTQKVAENPDDSESWRLLGRILRKKGDAERAKSCFEKAVELSPDSAAAQFDLGDFKLSPGQSR